MSTRSKRYFLMEHDVEVVSIVLCTRRPNLLRETCSMFRVRSTIIFGNGLALISGKQDVVKRARIDWRLSATASLYKSSLTQMLKRSSTLSKAAYTHTPAAAYNSASPYAALGQASPDPYKRTPAPPDITAAAYSAPIRIPR